MAQIADFISRLFSSGRTQGLSGGAEVVVDPDPASAFYAARMRKHRTESDFIDEPERLWSCSSFNGRKGGLRAHIAAEKGDGIASFTDVLIIVNQPDARRAAMRQGEPWTEVAARAVSLDFVEWCSGEKFELLYGTRPLRFMVVADGGRDMLGNSFGLEPGEFITGLLPNLYIGPAPRSKPVLAVHLALPGAWEGYREVGRLYSDQIVFTLGRHWLDNFRHPLLKEPGLYRLQQYPDGSLVHTISPELQERYFVRSDQADGGPSVLTVAEWEGRPIGYLVLAVMDSMTVEWRINEEVPLAAHSGDFGQVISPVAEAEAEVPPAIRSGDGTDPNTGELPPRIDLGGTPPSVGDKPLLPPSKSRSLDARTKTIVPDAFEQRLCTLHERGCLLQKVHFNNFMEGYDVFVGPRGQVSTTMQDPAATFQVRSNRVQLVAHGAGVAVDGRPLDVGRAMHLAGRIHLEVAGTTLEYRDLGGVKVDGWPYLGEIRRSGLGTYLDFGASYRIGRDRRCKVRLPDEPHNENIAWLASVGGGATIRSRTGDIPKSRFYTDSIMVASEHAELDLSAAPSLKSLARHCFTYVRRGEEYLALFPREGAGGRHDADLVPGDEILVGNCLFAVSYPPSAPPQAASLPPAAPKFDAASLAAAADHVLPGGRSRTVDPVVAGGLGERGPAPRPIDLAAVSASSEAARTPSKRGRASQTMPPPPPVAASPEAEGADAEAVQDAPSPRIGPKKVKLGDAAASGTGSRKKTETPANPDTTAKPASAAKPEPSAKPPPPMILDEADHGDPVVAVEESQWTLELARPARLVQVGWMVAAEGVIGNHRGAQLVVPEVRTFPEQAFMTLDYFRVSARGKRGRVELVQDGEATLRIKGGSAKSTDDLDNAELAIIRRDANLEPDFDVVLRFARDSNLPDPRARLLAIDEGDRLVMALFTLGLPLRSPRPVRLGPVQPTLTFDGTATVVSAYLSTYRTGASGFVPFFLREAGGNWRTFPEDGADVNLPRGAEIIAGNAVYRFVV